MSFFYHLEWDILIPARSEKLGENQDTLIDIQGKINRDDISQLYVRYTFSFIIPDIAFYNYIFVIHSVPNSKI